MYLAVYDRHICFVISFRIELLVADSFHSGIIPSGTLCASLDWLKATLLPKLKLWAETFKTEDVNLAQEKLHSLALVDIEEYTKIYNEMKSKYAEPLIKVVILSCLCLLLEMIVVKLKWFILPFAMGAI